MVVICPPADQRFHPPKHPEVGFFAHLLMPHPAPQGMNEFHHTQLAKGPEHARLMLLGLVKECSIGGNPEYCQLFEIRKLPYAQSSAWVMGLTNEECLKYYQNHLECMACHEKAVDEGKKP